MKYFSLDGEEADEHEGYLRHIRRGVEKVDGNFQSSQAKILDAIKITQDVLDRSQN